MKNKLSTKLKTTATITLILLMASVALFSIPVQAQEEQHGGTPDTQTVWSTTIPPGAVVNWTFQPNSLP